MVYLTAIASIALGALAQLLLKMGVGALPRSEEGWARIALRCCTEWHLIGGVACYGLSLLFWLYVLSQLELGKAYPMVSLGYVFTLLLGHFVLGEPVGLCRVAGILLIMAGVFFVARS